MRVHVGGLVKLTLRHGDLLRQSMGGMRYVAGGSRRAYWAMVEAKVAQFVGCLCAGY